MHLLLPAAFLHTLPTLSNPLSLLLNATLPCCYLCFPCAARHAANRTAMPRPLLAANARAPTHGRPHIQCLDAHDYALAQVPTTPCAGQHIRSAGDGRAASGGGVGERRGCANGSYKLSTFICHQRKAGSSARLLLGEIRLAILRTWQVARLGLGKAPQHSSLRMRSIPLTAGSLGTFSRNPTHSACARLRALPVLHICLQRCLQSTSRPGRRCRHLSGPTAAADAAAAVPATRLPLCSNASPGAAKHSPPRSPAAQSTARNRCHSDGTGGGSGSSTLGLAQHRVLARPAARTPTPSPTTPNHETRPPPLSTWRASGRPPRGTSCSPSPSCRMQRPARPPPACASTTAWRSTWGATSRVGGICPCGADGMRIENQESSKMPMHATVGQPTHRNNLAAPLAARSC